jgi:hypothetical protein
VRRKMIRLTRKVGTNAAAKKPTSKTNSIATLLLARPPYLAQQAPHGDVCGSRLSEGWWRC